MLKRHEAMEIHGKTLLVLTEMTNYGSEAMKYLLCLRGVFKTYGVRRRQGQGVSATAKPAAGGVGTSSGLGEAGKQALRETLDFLKPCLRA